MKRIPWGWLGAGAGVALVGYLVWRTRASPRASPVGIAVSTESPTAAARRARLMPLFRASSVRTGVPLAWLLAVARKESGFGNGRSAPGQRDDELGGAFGPLQVTSATAQAMGYAPGATHEARGRAILADPALGVELGARYLARLIGELGPDLPRVAAAYNAGPRRVRQGQVPARTLSEYVPKVVAYAHEYADVA